MSPLMPFLLSTLLLGQTASPNMGEQDVLVRDDEQLVRQAKLETDANSLLTFFRRRTLKEEDRQTIERLVQQLGSRSFSRREKATQQLIEWGPPVLPFLDKVKMQTDLELVRRAARCAEEINNGPGPALPSAAARLLVRTRAPESVQVLVDYLPFADSGSVQEEVLLALATLSREATLLTALQNVVKDADPLKRAAAGFVLGRSPEVARQLLVKPLLGDESSLVRLRTAQGFLSRHDKAAVVPLIGLLGERPSEQTWTAEDLLLQIAGEEAPLPPATAEDRERRDYRERWTKWWTSHADKIDLAKLAETPPQRGWTLIAQMSTSRVYEIDRQGKVRWTLDGLAGPIDAQILPGDRVLVAEHHGSRVSERNLKGKVLWDKTLTDRPVSIQRLPNGNTFIATYSGLLEVTREGREVYHHHPEGTQGRIYAAQKTKANRIVCVTLDGRILELDAVSGKVLKSFSSGLDGCYSIQALPRGGYLVSSYNQGQVVELDGAGKQVWRYELPSAYHAERLANGQTLVSSHGQSRVLEVDRNGKTLAEHSTNGNNVWRVHRR